MNHMKYRLCLIVLLVAALVFGIWFYTRSGEETEPYPGGTLVKREAAPQREAQL